MIQNFAVSKKINMEKIIKELEGQGEDQEFELMELIQKNKKEKKEEKDDGNMMNRYHKDAETNTADRERKIREKKIELKERKVPRAINFLEIMIISVFLLILGFSGISLYYKSELSTFIKEG